MKIALWPKEIVDNESLYMDTYLLDTETPCGAVIVCPGGGYSHLAEHEGRPIAEVFNSLGFHAFVLRYRICPTHFPEPQQDVLRGIKIVRMHANEWKINSDQIAVCG
ncbi:MAG: alpha/beta hydrolase, partial [Lentisphaeria bacterium]